MGDNYQDRFDGMLQENSDEINTEATNLQSSIKSWTEQYDAELAELKKQLKEMNLRYDKMEKTIAEQTIETERQLYKSQISELNEKFNNMSKKYVELENQKQAAEKNQRFRS